MRKINSIINKYKKLILLLLLIYRLKNTSYDISSAYKKSLFKESKKYNIFEYFSNNKTYKLINSNFTMNQYKIKGLEFLNTIKKRYLINVTTQINKNPKLSVIIPLYNCEKTIELTIKSIHFQNLKDIEIILINDFSSDNSSKIIKELQSFDKRIKIINNNKNMGTLYSRCIGTLNAKGEYIIGLDNDDLFLYEEVLETVYLNAKFNNFDIVEIKSLNIPDYSPNIESISKGEFTKISNVDNYILYQPELGSFSISYYNKFHVKDHFAWGKCIKSSIYRRAVNMIGKERYSIYNCWTEDISIVFVLFNIAKSFIFLNLYGIFRFKGLNRATIKLSNKHKFLSDIFYLGIIFDFSKDDSTIKNIIAKFALSFPIISINKLDINFKLNFKSYIKKIIECKYISLKYKKKIIEKYNSTILNI